VKADLGVSIISRYALQDELVSGSVREIAIHGMSMSRMLYIASASKRTLPHHYQVFLNSIVQSRLE
jgi:DNA-binding transcriptional LysR family regulator